MEQRPNIKALLALVHTAQTGSMTRGAERLGMNQSAVSHYIGDLETFIGEALFERSHQGVIPTQLGEQLCGQALTVLEALDRFTEVANGELLSPPIKILSFPRLADTLLAPAIADTIRAAPHARFKVELRSRRELGQGRSRDSHDAIIMTMLSPAHEHPDKIGRVPLFAVMHRHHALSRRTRLKVADLDGHGVIQLEHGTLMRHIADELFALEGIDPLTLVETSSSPHALQLAASGVGIFIVDGLYPAPFSPSLSVIPLDCRNQSIDVVIKRPAGSNELPALDLLIGNVSARMQAHLDRLPEAA